MSADREALRRIVIESLATIAPDVDGARLDPAAIIRREADLDSFDFLQFCIQIAQRSGVDVPEADYGRLATIESCVEYLAKRSERG